MPPPGLAPVSLPPPAAPPPLAPTLQIGPRRAWGLLIDVALFFAVFAAVYGLYTLGHSWIGPVKPSSEISQSPRALPLYAFYSLVRIMLAYMLSLLFALGYGYAAVRSKRAEAVLIPLLDILQSIPVLSFLPGVMLAMVAIFPNREIGVELGSILLIFTGQVWNIAFSFYSSLKTIPRELHEAARIFRFGKWQRFFELELPFSTIGIVWNSMMSVAGGWFFLMACEMFVLGDRDFRLPGLGSYLQVAASNGNTKAILWGLGTMIVVIVLLDQLVWRPVIAWADKFKFEQVEASDSHHGIFLAQLGRASFVVHIFRRLVKPTADWLTVQFARGARHAASKLAAVPRAAAWRRWSLWVLAAAIVVLLGYAGYRGAHEIAQLPKDEVMALFGSAGKTFLRVNLALALAVLWTVPAGVAIGWNPRLARIAQPLAQIAASVPATALFPILLLVLLRYGGGMELAALLLMLLGTQWYVLFNVIAGALAIPTDLREAAEVFRFSRWDRWRLLILPGIFPYLVTGLVTASGGAWNASIVAEYFHFQGTIHSARGLGSTISRASDSGEFGLLLAATLLMAGIVVLVNRLVWRRMYRLASTRYRLEA